MRYAIEYMGSTAVTIGYIDNNKVRIVFAVTDPDKKRNYECEIACKALNDYISQKDKEIK